MGVAATMTLTVLLWQFQDGSDDCGVGNYGGSTIVVWAGGGENN